MRPVATCAADATQLSRVLGNGTRFYCADGFLSLQNCQGAIAHLARAVGHGQFYCAGGEPVAFVGCTDSIGYLNALLRSDVQPAAVK